MLSNTAQQDDYVYFLKTLKSKSTQSHDIMFNDKNIVFGSDQERALINAMKEVFPQSTPLLSSYCEKYFK